MIEKTTCTLCGGTGKTPVDWWGKKSIIKCRRCLGIGSIEKIKRCEFCNKPFTDSQFGGKEQKYCSEKCQRSAEYHNKKEEINEQRREKRLSDCSRGQKFLRICATCYRAFYSNNRTKMRCKSHEQIKESIVFNTPLLEIAAEYVYKNTERVLKRRERSYVDRNYGGFKKTTEERKKQIAIQHLGKVILSGSVPSGHIKPLIYLIVMERKTFFGYV
jgi:hypothetical protein